MKKIFLYVISACMLAGCSLERLPYDKYTREQVEADLDIMLTGCYSKLKSWANNMHYVGEFGGDNVMKQATSTDSWFEFISYNHTPTNSRMYTFWEDSYKVISQTSDMLKIGKEGESDEIDQMLGEAYCLRGMMYFYLCRTFGRPYYQDADKNLGVPLVFGLPDDPMNAQYPNRATVKDTYAQIISDLRAAERLMESEKRSIYASKEVAQALLSRVYLYMSGTYETPVIQYADSAIYFADQVLDAPGYDLLSHDKFMKYQELEPDNPSQTETIFAVKRILSEYSSSDLFGSIGGMYSSIHGVGWGEVYASADYLDLLYETEGYKDARWSFIDRSYKSETDAFRFVAESYNKEGELTGYTWYQGEFEVTGNGTGSVSLKEGDNLASYPLTLVNEPNKAYAISYDGKTYIGYVDKEMTDSNGYLQFYIIKCSLQGGQTQVHSPIVIRLAEMYLNKAEAYVKQGLYDQARDAVNMVRGRAIEGGEYDNNDFNAATAADLVVKERRLELAFEAHRTPDIYRLGHTLTRRYPGVHNQLLEVPATSPRVIQYIPQDEINAYPGPLTQNP